MLRIHKSDEGKNGAMWRRIAISFCSGLVDTKTITLKAVGQPTDQGLNFNTPHGRRLPPPPSPTPLPLVLVALPCDGTDTGHGATRDAAART